SPRVVLDDSEAPTIPLLPPSILGTRILVMSDIQPPSETVVAAIDGLRGMGFAVMGNYPGNAAAPEELDRQLDLESEAKFVRGLGVLGSAETSADIAEWLRGEGTEP